MSEFSLYNCNWGYSDRYQYLVTENVIASADDVLSFMSLTCPVWLCALESLCISVIKQETVCGDSCICIFSVGFVMTVGYEFSHRGFQDNYLLPLCSDATVQLA